MLLIPVLLSAITFNPAAAAMTPLQGYVHADVVPASSSTCAAGAICGKGTLPVKRNGCYVDNFYNGSLGGTPLTIDVTESGPNGSPVYIYWVNALSTAITIKSAPYAKYYCP